MSTTNNAVLANLSNESTELNDAMVAGPAAAQGTAVRLLSQASRCIKAASTGSFVLPSILTGEATRVMWLLNDTAVTINVYPALGENANGSLNTAFQITTGLTGVFVPVLNSHGGTLDWRAALIP